MITQTGRMRLTTVTALSLSAFLVCSGVTPRATATILRVAQTGDGTNGESWETAYNTVAEALVSAETDDEIWMKAGRYNEAIVLPDGVSLYGGFSGTEEDGEFALRNWRSNETILDATRLDRRVVEGADRTVLDGLTIANGYTDKENGGAGVYCFDAEMTIRNCRLLNNRTYKINWPASTRGGGISAFYATLIIENCEIIGNRALWGGGIFVHLTSLGLENCLLDSNSVTAIRSSASDTSLSNCTFGMENYGNPYEPANFYGSGTARAVGCISRKGMGVRDISYSNVLDASGEGNIDEDPQWTDPENGDYRLKVSSPCIDSGSTTGQAKDLDGNPRPVDVLGTGRDGPGAYDMGCYEFQLPKADLNSDGRVNAPDLFLFEEQWHSQ